MKQTKKLVAFLLSATLLFSSAIPVSAVDFDYTIEKGSVLGSGDVTDTTHASTLIQLDNGDLIAADVQGSAEAVKVTTMSASGIQYIQTVVGEKQHKSRLKTQSHTGILFYRTSVLM